MKPIERRVAILGDSRVFDTYFLNDHYQAGYGYDRTFPFLLRRRLWEATDGAVETIHIPDHFRAYSMDNNILRLALTDPDVVILCSGIWETLVNKQTFIDYAAEAIRDHPTHSGRELTLTYSSKALADLFLADKLKYSPRKFIERQRRIVSYFRRRRRRVMLMNLVVPPVAHLNRVHYAGNHRLFPDWDRCLEALNQGLSELAGEYGAEVIDVHRLLAVDGDIGDHLLDQWHFSDAGHSRLADHLAGVLAAASPELDLDAGHVSRDFALHRPPGDHRLILLGQGQTASDWLRRHPQAKVEAVVAAEPGQDYFYSIPVVAEGDLTGLAARVVVLAVAEADRTRIETGLLRRLPRDFIIVYPEELGGVVNPMPESGDRPEYE